MAKYHVFDPISKTLELKELIKNQDHLNSKYSHPHPDPVHIMCTYRRYLLGIKKNYSRQRRPSDEDKRVPQTGARGLIHYRLILNEYLCAKRKILHEQLASTIQCGS